MGVPSDIPSIHSLITNSFILLLLKSFSSLLHSDPRALGAAVLL